MMGGSSRLAVALLAFFTVSEARPAALVFENAWYQKLLADTGVGSLIDLIDCSGPGSCNPPSADISKRVVAYVAAQPRNLSLLAELPNLKLYQSTWYEDPTGGFFIQGYPPENPAAVPHGVIVAGFYAQGHDLQFTIVMAEFVAASMWRWNFQLEEKENTFRRCAWAADAPLSCPPMTTMTGRRSLRGMTFGIIGYGAVGTVMAEYMAKLGMRVVASKRSGPFKPTPPNLAWLSGNNDEVWRASDFVLVSVPDTISVINKTSLSLMKPTAVLTTVNPLFDDEIDALYGALSTHSIAGAILDAWSHGCMNLSQTCGPPYGEHTWPSKDKRLLTLDNVQLTANNLNQDDSFWVLSAKGVAANLKALVTGGKLSNIIQKADGKPPTEDDVTKLPPTMFSRSLAAEESNTLEGMKPAEAARVASSSCIRAFQFLVFGVACFILGARFGDRCQLRTRIISHPDGSTIEVNEQTKNDYVKMAA